MSVELKPDQFLTFDRPLTRVVKEVLLIRNPHSQPVAFKVKTTAPKQYCVRPNSGIVKPNESLEVQILLQPFKVEPPQDFKCKDKFLVQSVFVDEDQMSMPISDLWANVESTAKDTIYQQKLRCTYLPVDAMEHEAEEVHMPVSNSSRQVNGTESAAAAATMHEAQEEEQTTVVQNDAQEKLAEMEQKLKAYENEIQQLRKKSSPQQQEQKVIIQPAAGYSSQVLLMVAVAAFILSYLTFLFVK